MYEEAISEFILQYEQIFAELIISLHLVLRLYRFLPHTHEFPRFELLEESEVLYVVVGIAFDEPLAKGHKLNRSVLLV